MNFEELSVAANNFSKNNIIGMGKMGAVYKATVSNGNWFLAIKRIPNSQNFDHEFFSEVMALGRLKHPNIVRLLGFSSKDKEKLLVYKYEPNGSLYERLHSMKGETQTMEWPVRVKIAVGLARGLAWLHHNHYLPTAHLNVSSKCILLNPKFEPKLSNFTGAIFFNANNTKVAKSKTCELGHMKKDVYSFGVVLLELITGKKPSETNDSRNPERTSDVCYDLDEVVDKSLIWKEFDGEIIQLLRIACDCVQPLPDERPTMVQVYKTLRAMGEKYGLSDDSQTSTLLIFEMDPWRLQVK